MMIEPLRLLETACTAASTVAIILVIVVGVLVYFYAPYWSVRKIPGPLALPLIGHLHLIARHGTDLFSILSKQYGPIYRFHMGRQPLVIISDPELCREVGVKKFKDFPNRSIPSPITASPIHQKGLMFSKDTQWSTMRNSIVSVYQPSHLASLIPTMHSYIESATKYLDTKHKQDYVSFDQFSLTLSTDMIGQAAFGVDFGLRKHQQQSADTTSNFKSKDNAAGEANDFIRKHMHSTTSLKMDLSGSWSIIIGLLMPILQEPFRQILRRIPWSMDYKVERTNLELTSILNKIVEKRSKEDTGSKDFLSKILSAREADEVRRNAFTPDYVSAITYEHLLAGSTTTSFTLSCILYLVAGHEMVEKKLLDEIDAFGGRDQVPSADDLEHKFAYLDQVLKEAMRFYLVSPLVAREANKDVKIGGYSLPKGTWVWMALGALAMDSKNFPEPDKFKPDRFDPNCNEEKTRHPYAYAPFGIGPRACVGQKFALQEIKLAVIHLYRNYVFRHSPDMEKPLEFQYGIVLNFKHGVKLIVIDR